MNERDWINRLLELLDDCRPFTATRAHARLILNNAEAEGYQPVQPIDIPSKTGVDIGWSSTHNPTYRGADAPPID